MSDGKRVEVTYTDSQYERVVREADKRGKTLAGYVRERSLADASPDAGALADLVVARLAHELDRRLLAVVETLATVALLRQPAPQPQPTTEDRRAFARGAVGLFRARLAVADDGADPVRGGVGSDDHAEVGRGA